MSGEAIRRRIASSAARRTGQSHCPGSASTHLAKISGDVERPAASDLQERFVRLGIVLTASKSGSVSSQILGAGRNGRRSPCEMRNSAEEHRPRLDHGFQAEYRSWKTWTVGTTLPLMAAVAAAP